MSFYPGDVLKPAPRPRHRRLWISAGVAVVVLVGAVCGVGWWAYSRATADDITRANTGDCVGAADEEEPPYRLVPCGSTKAEFTVLRMLPGTADEVLTVDGLRAIYGPGEGNRVLSVYVPNGNFTVVVWLDGVNDSRAKTIGTAVFRIARPRLPA